MAVATFVEFCVQRGLAQPPDKIVKNLCTFLCQDVDQTPTFAFSRKHLDGILSFNKTASPVNGKGDAQVAEDAAKARLSRRGASLAFVQLSDKFGHTLLEVVPKMWQSMAGGLLSACTGGMWLWWYLYNTRLLSLQINLLLWTASSRKRLAKMS